MCCDYKRCLAHGDPRSHSRAIEAGVGGDEDEVAAAAEDADVDFVAARGGGRGFLVTHTRRPGRFLIVWVSTPQ